MIMSLFTIRHVIGKNTKFKQNENRTSLPDFFQNFVLSFTIVALVVFPVVGSGSSAISSSDSSEFVNKAWSHDENFRFVGGGERAPQELPFSERLKRSLVGGDQINGDEERVTHFIKKHMLKYKRSVKVVHSHLEEDEDEGHLENGDNPKTDNSTDHSTSRRLKRATIYQDAEPNLARMKRKTVNHESEGTFVINQVDRASPQHYDSKNAIDINCQRLEDKTYVFSIEMTERGREIMAHELNEKNLQQRLLFSVSAPEAQSVEVLKMRGKLFVFTTVNHLPQIAGSTKTINTGSTLYEVNFSSGTFEKIQTIHLPFATSSAFWTGMGEEANEMFLALAPEKSIFSSDKTSYNVHVPLYRWQGGYFDFVSDLPASNPQSIQHFAMFSHDYLAVSNYQDDTGSTSVQSEIFKYYHKESRFVSWQKIQTYGAKDIRHFTFSNEDERRQEHFIAIANSCKRDESGKPQFYVQSTIMKFGSTRFLPFKSFYSYGALQFLPVKDGNKFFLAFADFHGLRLFQYNGWTFVETFSKQFSSTAEHQTINSPFSLRLRQLEGTSQEKTYFTIATTNQQVENGMFGVSFETRNDHRKLVTSVEGWCNGANMLMTRRSLPELVTTLNSAPQVNASKIDIKGEVKFLNSVTVQQLTTQSLRLGHGRNLDPNKFKQISGIEKKFKNLERRMSSFPGKFHRAVMVNEIDQDQTINSPVLFAHDVTLENKVFEVKHLKVINSMGPIQVNDHLNNLILLNQPTKLQTIVTDNVITDDISLTTLNGITLAGYALRHPATTDKQVFTGKNEFLSAPLQVTKEIQTDHKFAGLSFTHPEFLLFEGNQTFTGTTMQLTDSKVKNMYTRKFNGVDVFTMLNDAVKLSGGVITAEKRFVGGAGVKMKNVEVDKINEVNIQSLYDDAVFASGGTTQTFTNPVYFENMEIEQITPQNPNINEQFDVNFNFIKKDGQQYSVKNMKMTKPTRISRLSVNTQLNNVKALQDSTSSQENSNKRLDLLLKNSDELQHVKSKKLQSVHFTQNVEASQLVDGVHLEGWSNEQKIILEENEFQGVLNIPDGHLKFDDGLSVGKSFTQSGENALHALHNSARLDAETLPGNCALHFDRLAVVGNSDVRGRVNQVLPAQWVVNSDKSSVLDVTGKKVFTGQVHLEKDVGANALYGRVENENKKENLVEVFPNLLLDGVDQKITDELAFIGQFRVNQATCPNAILDQVPFENLLFKKGGQTVEVATTFRRELIARGDVLVDGDMKTVLVNGMDINSQLKNTLRTNGKEIGAQRITGSWQFDALDVTDSTEVSGMLASGDVKSLYGDIIRKDSEIIELDGVNLKFGSGATMKSAEVIGRINSIPTTDWGNAWLLSRTNQVVETKVEFAGPVEAQHFHAPSVNDVDINHLSENILRIDRDEVVDGDGSSMSFQSGVQTTSGISMPNGVNVNGIDLANDVLLRNSEDLQTISGAKIFKNGITVQGDMIVNDIPGFDIVNFANLVSGRTAVENEDHSPTSLHIKGNLQLKHEPEVGSSVNGNNWNELINTLWTKDKNVVLDNPVKFRSLKLGNGGTLEESATLNGVDLEQLKNNYASKSRSQTWTGEVTLEQIENAEKISAESLSLENDGKFNDVDIQEFYDSVLRYTGDQEIVGRDLEADNLIVERLHGEEGKEVQINDINAQDFMTVSGPNVVKATKTLKKLKAKSLVLSKDTVIDGVNLGEWDEGAVRRTGSHEIKGPVEFESLETTENVVVDGFVDSMKFDLENIVTTDKDQVLPNIITIKQPNKRPSDKLSSLVKARKGVVFKGMVNGMNVKDSISNMVFKNDEKANAEMEPIVIKGTTVFNGPLILNQVKTDALIQGQNISAMMDNMARSHDQVHSKGFKANEGYSSLLEMTKRMLTVSEKRAVFLDYYVLTQTIKVPATYVKVLRQVGYPTIAMGFKKSEKITTENWWSYSSAVDYYQLQIGNRVQMEGTVRDIAELSSNDAFSNNINKNVMFAFAVNSESDERPAQTALEMMKTNSVQNFELDKSPDKLSKTFILQSVDVGTPHMRPAVSQVIYSHEFKSVQSFDVVTTKGTSGRVTTRCMAATTKTVNELDNSLKIFCLDGASGLLETVQEMNLESPSLTTSTRVPSTDTTLLAILTRSGKGHPEGLLEIWSHQNNILNTNKGNSGVQFSKQSCLPVFNAISLDSLTTRAGKTFLAVASGALRGSEYQGSVFIYRYDLETQHFKKVQTIQANHPIDVKLQWLQPSNEVVMYVLSQAVTNNVQVYKRQGLSGWSLVHQFTSENGKSLQVAGFKVDGIYRAQLLVTSPSQTNIYAAEFVGVNTLIEEELMESSHQNSISSSSLREFEFDNL